MNLVKIPCPGYLSPAGRATHPAWVGDYFGSNSYPTGGTTLAATDLGMSGIETLAFSFGGYGMNSTGVSPYFFRAHPSAGAIVNTEIAASAFGSVVVQAYYTANSTEASNGTDLSGVGARLEVIGV
jgi:hypothetical protein